MAAIVKSSPERTVSLWRGQVSHQHEDLEKCMDHFAKLIVATIPSYHHKVFPKYEWEWLKKMSLQYKLKPIWWDKMQFPFMTLWETSLAIQQVIAVAIKFEKIEENKKVQKVKVFSLRNRFELETQTIYMPNANKRLVFEVTAHLDCEEGPIIEAMLKEMDNQALIAAWLRKKTAP